MYYSGPRSTQHASAKSKTAKQLFHEQQEAALEQLIRKKPLNPLELTQFVQDYKNKFAKQFHRAMPRAALTIPLFNKAGKHYIKLFAEILEVTANDPRKSLADLATAMDLFITHFPDGSKTLIHYQGSDEFKLFSTVLNTALRKKYGEEGRFNVAAHGHCAEALLLQSLAMLPIAISSAKPKTITPSRATKQRASTSSSSASSSTSQPSISTQLNEYGEIIAEFIERTSRFFNSPRQVSGKHLTLTAAALSYFDIEAFATVEKTDHPIMPEDVIVNHPIEHFVNSCLNRLYNTTDAHVIIRAMHAIILVSPSTDFNKYLSKKMAAQLLNSINTTFNPMSPEDRALANQLFIIKNTYPDIFPSTLATAIAPFVKTFQQQAHGSAFEIEIQRELRKAITQLERQYPGLIEAKNFNYHNPISATLGLESDVAYEDGQNKVCLQIDGDKYHRYIGSGRKTQRTLLRDNCFKSEAWKLVTFSDSDKGLPYTLTMLKDNVVIPAFELQTAENIAKVENAATRLVDIHKTLASLKNNPEQTSTLESLQQQTQQAMSDSSLFRDEQQTQFITELKTLEQDLYQIQTLIESQQNALSNALSVDIPNLETAFDTFDYSAATQLTNFHTQVAALQTTLIAQQTDANQLAAELQMTQAIIDKNEAIVNSQTPSMAESEATLTSQRVLLSQQLARYNALKSSSVADLQKAKVTRKALNDELIPELEKQIINIDRQLHGLSEALKRDSSVVSAAKEAFEKASTKKNMLIERQRALDVQLSTTIWHLDDLEKQLSAPVMGTTLLAQYDCLLETIPQAMKTQQDIESKLKQATNTLMHLNGQASARKAAIAAAKKSKLNVNAEQFVPSSKLAPRPASSSQTETMQPAMYPAHGTMFYYSPAGVMPYYYYPQSAMPTDCSPLSSAPDVKAPSAILHAYSKSVQRPLDPKSGTAVTAESIPVTLPRL